MKQKIKVKRPIIRGNTLSEKQIRVLQWMAKQTKPVTKQQIKDGLGYGQYEFLWKDFERLEGRALIVRLELRRNQSIYFEITEKGRCAI